MKLYIFTPNREAIFTREIEQRLNEKFELVFYTEIKPLKDHVDFINDESEKVVALDPDFFDWKFSKEEIDLCKNVKAFCLQTTSFTWIDSTYAKEKSIPVLSLVGFSAESVAEYIFMMALGLARKLPLMIQDNFIQDFIKHQGIELRGKTAGIIGLGRIGSAIAEKCKGFGMKTIYWSKSSKNSDYEYTELETLLETADVIFVSISHNQETANLLPDSLLNKIKKEAILLTTSHKYNVFNPETVIKKVQNGEMYGFGMEGDNGDPRKISGNILILPAVAWATNESMQKNSQMWAESMIDAGENMFSGRIN